MVRVGVRVGVVVDKVVAVAEAAGKLDVRAVDPRVEHEDVHAGAVVVRRVGRAGERQRGLVEPVEARAVLAWMTATSPSTDSVSVPTTTSPEREPSG